jgi:hypothetical protein
MTSVIHASATAPLAADLSREPIEKGRRDGMYSFAIRVGRLVEAELRAPLSANDVEGFRQETRLALLSLKSPAVAVTILVGLQIGRIVREGLSKDRRLFDDKKVLATWLGEVLTEPEKARLAVVLAEVEAG